MKVRELIEKLKKVDQEKDVYIPIETDRYEYYVANSVDEKTLAIYGEEEDCIIIDFE